MIELGSAVSKLAWAHPYYGQLIACAGYRGHLSIFAEEPGAELQQGQMTWAARMDFSDTHAITDLRFAPQQLGLILVACYADGFVRFLKAEAPFEPVEWRVVVSANLRGSGVPTVDWCERRTWDYVMALGAREGDHGVRLYHYDQESLYASGA
ncbi:hypothetical protein PTSG_07230 [Salpingoeca rosetta]|uniref:Uncharacterized protein n=1 Tax=Salpingoeca rosetta (strain ATCC 50818 / BSB-021) TaxID=946362 RepID=F2UEF6_SALR5|nr:uncharacterized protein PTSG_07230 [Salpingoeca rosetta]EGD75006.1 hypothetical protein PTSG_07230 [Salpingoeca rosetta]|eukprot:XP_004992650.1 hypothetical protein PTSG_07230 [Salpingoeca rosetta]